MQQGACLSIRGLLSVPSSQNTEIKLMNTDVAGSFYIS
jgi:hypothetical protein